jgi:cysteinyl-tRNA synthetase
MIARLPKAIGRSVFRAVTLAGLTFFFWKIETMKRYRTSGLRLIMLLGIFLIAWTGHPFGSAAAGALRRDEKVAPAWTEINDFLFQLQNLDLEAIGATAYDLVVIDYSADGSDEQAFTADQIAALQHSPGGPKRVLAYLSIGEAETYRYYWNPAWDDESPRGIPDEDAPAWLDVENPNWEGNYKVHYWDPAWQTIIFGTPDSYLDRILARGYDGVYLDLVDAYWYYQEQGRTTAAQEMVDFVRALTAYARSVHPGFAVFAQNAEDLAADYPEYLAALTGVGREDIYYGDNGDNEPTPRDETAWIEQHLDPFAKAGKLVLTIDYATTPAHIDDAYARSLAKGYIPFVTVRALDQLTINPGHEPN